MTYLQARDGCRKLDFEESLDKLVDTRYTTKSSLSQVITDDVTDVLNVTIRMRRTNRQKYSIVNSR